MKQKMSWWYLSYADKKFRGAAIVFAKDLVHACHKAAQMGIAPGGQVLGAPIPESEVMPDHKYRNRLLTTADIKEFWPDAVSIKDAAKEGLDMDALHENTDVLCADCVAGICKEHVQ